MGFYGDLMGIHGIYWDIPSGKLRVCYGKPPILRGKPTINGHFQLY